MEFTVYVLFSKTSDKIYIGYTSNLSERLLSHNILATKGWTIKFRPWGIIHSEVFPNKAEAMRREKQLKSSRGRAFIRAIIKERAAD
jgi:putative endonuclease